MLIRLLLIAVSLISTLAALDLPGDELLPGGDFAGDLAAGWQRRGAAVEVVGMGRDRCLVLGPGSGIEYRVPLDPAWRRVQLQLRIRSTDLVPGEQGWQNGRVALSFHAADGSRVGDWPRVADAQGSTEWTAFAQTYTIPAGAVRFHVSPSHFGQGGRVSIDDLSLRPMIASVPQAGAVPDAPLPSGAPQPWDMTTAWQQASVVRASICLNDLWRFLPDPAGDHQQPPPADVGWGWFKVPGIWPNSSNWHTRPVAQEVILPPLISSSYDPATLDRAWYQRELRIPADWQGQAISLRCTMVHSRALVYLDDQYLGDLTWPDSQVDLTPAAKPGRLQRLSLCLIAKPIQAEQSSFMAADREQKTAKQLTFKGIAGDCFLERQPQQTLVGSCRYSANVAAMTLQVDVGLHDLPAGERRLRVDWRSLDGRSGSLMGSAFSAADLVDGRLRQAIAWPDAQVWDLDSPANRYALSVAVVDAQDRVLDASLPQPYGFRSIAIDGRDIMLNGTPVHLRVFHVDNLSHMADVASEAGCLATFERAKRYGFNAVMVANYGYSEGDIWDPNTLLSAADEAGMLVCFSLPHAAAFDWRLDEAVVADAYRALCTRIIDHVQGHPSLALYALNHNACGYKSDQDPQRIDGEWLPESLWGSDHWSSRRRATALIGQQIVQAIDPSRPTYHHSSGNLGQMHTLNCYLNWAPIRERNDWLRHWSQVGTKPLFFVEWGMPHISSWSSYRGPHFIWRTEAVQQLWDSEFAAVELGQPAYTMTPVKQAAIDHETTLWAKGDFAWASLIAFWRHGMGPEDRTYQDVQAAYFAQNWRSHRAYGMSAGQPWDQEAFWSRSDTVPAQANPDRWRGLQEPGPVADSLHDRGDFEISSDHAVYRETAVGRALARWNQPLLAFIGGDPAVGFTDRSHIYRADEVISKQVVVVNDGRRPVSLRYRWQLADQQGAGGIELAAGERAVDRLPIVVPAGSLTPGRHTLQLTVTTADGREQTDSCVVQVLPAERAALPASARIACFDPVGISSADLQRLGVAVTMVDADSDLQGVDLLIIGREALSEHRALPDLSPVATGMRLLVLEQTSSVLEDRLGFRMQEVGYRRCFVRAGQHPLLSGLNDELLRDWRGASTLLASHLDEAGNTDYPHWRWAGADASRVWRNGNGNTVCSVPIEKPERGDWLPLIDGGFDLQFTPLLESRIGAGRVLFCQLDVSGRSEASPMADLLLHRSIAYLAALPVAPADTRPGVAYSGAPAGQQLLQALGFTICPPAIAAVQVCGPGGDHQAALASGKPVFFLGADAAALQTAFPEATVRVDDALPAPLPDLSQPWLQGLSNAEQHVRRRISAPTIFVDEQPRFLHGRLAGDRWLVASRLAPWQLDYQATPALRTSYRRNLAVVSQVLRNLGAQAASPVLERLAQPGLNPVVSLHDGWIGRADPDDLGEQEAWFTAALDESAWESAKVQASFEDFSQQIDKDYDGRYWYRRHFTIDVLPADDQQVTVTIGPVDDESWVWLNGQMIGSVTKANHPHDHWAYDASYTVSASFLRQGDNVLVVCCNDTFRTGGMRGRPMLTYGTPTFLRSDYLQTPIPDDNPYRYYRW